MSLVMALLYGKLLWQLQEVGCTDAIVFGENYHSPVVIRDDSRGVPLGKVAGRYDWETNGNVKNADNEASSQSWIMFKIRTL